MCRELVNEVMRSIVPSGSITGFIHTVVVTVGTELLAFPVTSSRASTGYGKCLNLAIGRRLL
jgi:hypothetical protein